MAFWGPLPNGEYLLVMIDKYTTYPEVEFTNSTRARTVIMIQHINRVFASHRFPDTVKTDGGPPFKGTGSPKYQMYMKWAGVKTIAVSPENPEANGLAENFMKPLSKVRHHTPPPAKPQPNYCSTANSQCACQSYKSQYMTPNYRQKKRKRPTRILK